MATPSSAALRKKRVCLAVAFCCLLSVPLAACASAGIAMQYTRRVWHMQDGLPEETVQAVSQARPGFLWVGTTGGLVRFDGSHFTNSLAPHLSTRLTGDSIFCILAAHDGSLWFGTQGAGLLHLKNGVFHSYGAPQGLDNPFVRSIMEDHQGRVWVGTDDGLYRIARGKVERVATPPFPQLAVHAIFEDREHRTWVGGSKLLAFTAGGMRTYPLPGTYSENRIKSIFQTNDGTIWVGTVGGLDRLVNGTFHSVPGIAGTVRSLAQTDDGKLWIGTIGHGLYTLNRKRVLEHAANRLLPSQTILSIFVDREQQIWIGTQDGLVCLDKTPIQVVPLPGGSDPDYETISSGVKGTVWVVASTVYAIRGGVGHGAGAARPYRFAQLPNVPVRNVFHDRAGTLWIGTDGSGAYHITPSGVVHYFAPQNLVNNFVRAFLEARDKSIWVATDQGVSRIDQGRVQNFRMHDGLAYFGTRAIIQARDGSIWIGTDNGLSRWRDGQFLHGPVIEQMRHEKIWSILEDHDGDLWFGTRDHGLYRDHEGKLTHYTRTQGLASNSIFQILEDHRGRLWLSGPNTISSFRPPQPFQPAPVPGAPPLQVIVYTLPYGAQDAVLYGGRQPSGCLGQDGAVWFPSNRGALRITPYPARPYIAPKILITEAVSDGHNLLAGNSPARQPKLPEDPGAGSTVIRSPLRLPAEASRLEFAFTPLLLLPQQDMRFRFRLRGFDKQWTDANGAREATYTNLPAGRFVFQVVGFTANHPNDLSETSLTIIKQPYFYQTWWFLGACILGAGLVIWGAYSSRMHIVQSRFQAVLEERNRLAREMHDTVIQGCTSISALIEAVSSLQHGNDMEGRDLLDSARMQARSTIDEARQAVWNLRHEDQQVSDFPKTIAALADNVRRESGLRVEFTATGKQLPIESVAARELLMVVREAVSNAVRHSHAQTLSIALDCTSKRLSITITDDGIGFDLQAAARNGHYGINGMRERMKKIHGRIALVPVQPHGVKVAISVAKADLLAGRGHRG